jgi:hypothetical protein
MISFGNFVGKPLHIHFDFAAEKQAAARTRAKHAQSGVGIPPRRRAEPGRSARDALVDAAG